uniref:Putative LOC101893139 [Musca domestica] n=1 Tax=Lepeophtheirus salmonis TaxID=72036 RepID=A0A0K2TAS5_LEPSM
MDKDCPSQEACIDRECQNPCLSFRPCVENAECRVYNTLPLRTMTCSCREGYSGKGDEKCELITEPIVVGCSNDRDCSTSLACRNTECVNPCAKDRPCAQTARCEVNRHKSHCTCPPGMTGDPYSICVIIEDHECEQDSDCNGNKACVEYECIDPCIKDKPCGRNAICKTIDHRPVCKCQSGTAGDPHSFCYEYECLRDNDCPLNKACVSQKCTDPCLTTDCGIKAKCKTEYHRGICVCEEGLQGSPFIECKEVECRKERDCKTNEKCDMNTYKCFPLCDFENPCAEGASCLAQNHKEKCVCQPPLLGNGFVLCSLPVKTEEPECRIDDDCPSKHACINRKCQNPCSRRNPCLPSETCLVVDSSPSKSVSCSCREGFYVGKNGDCIEVDGQPECRSHSDCRYNEQCQSGSCLDACRIRLCGINAICVAENHESTCACRIRFSGNPEVACLPISPLVVEALPPGCRSDSECPTYNQCQNNKCVDPCIVNDPCGKDAFCKVNYHVPLCRCPEGFEGDPSIECKPPTPLSIGCSADSDCPVVEACLNTKCVDPCNCGENALCRKINHKAVCFCPSGFSGNPEVLCEKLECTSDEDCSNDKMCHENTCANPCILLNPCAINGECIPSNHVSKCRCPSDMNGDPYSLCVDVECAINEDCNSERACYQDKCIDPCVLDNPCAPNALCKTVQHASSCVCIPPLIGNPFVSCVEKEPSPIEVEKECVVDSDCPSQLACLNDYCENPCYSLTPCHTSAMCSVVDTSPFRTMVCTCREGWIPQEDRSCIPIETPNPPGCVKDDECPSNEACVNRMCRNPCNCGGGAKCFLSGHRPICQCPEGFIGNPQIECNPAGCSSDKECRSTEACVEASCVNPCLINDPCGVHAKCAPNLHNAQCECDEGFEGDPYTGCSIIGCKSDSECPNKKACRNRDCIDPCLKDNPCAVFANCVSRDHFAQCRCKVGYQGDPYESCTVIPPPECVEDGDCTTGMACINEKCDNPCEVLKPCAEQAICHVIESLPVKPMTCECPDGYVKGELKGCKTLPPIISGCERNDDCSNSTSCINAICRSPCACGLNADCKIIDHQPVCTCKPGFYGDPEIECTDTVCQSDNECQETHACRNGECTQVCGADNLPCGGEAECRGVAHQATCYCPAGLTGNPFVTCNIVSCSDNSDCPTDKECINKLCTDSCSISNPCGSKSECKVKNHKVDCSCALGFIGNKGTSCVKVSVTCEVDEDCPSKQSCIEKECLNPCVYNEPCGINAYCSVYDTVPVRTMTCSCIEGYEGDASIECFPVKTCPANSGLILDNREECVCPTGFGFTENKDECIPCLKENGFILNNEGKCVCNDARGYEYNPDSGKCECPPGERLNNFGICERVPDCEEDPDCPTQKYCEKTNGTCSNPCTRNPCGPNAFGDPYDHICHCQCIKGYSGDPNLGCIPVIIPPVKTDFPRPEMVVNCLSDGVLVNVDLKDGGNFRGVMYVKGHSKDSNCIKHIDSGGSLKPIDFQVSFGKCGLFHSQGEANFVLVVQKHPKLETYKAQAYRIKCLYDVGETNINVNFNVSMITTAGTVRNDGPPPNCTMKICNENGEDISSANVGEKLMLKVIVSPREIYGGLARSCIARSLDDSKFEEEYAVTDANGCATDPEIFQEWKLDRNTGYLTALFDAFKFPDSINLKFKCIVRICFGQCQPQNCGGRNAFGRRRKRESSHIIDGKVYTGQLREETDVYSNAIETLESSPQNEPFNSATLGSGLESEGDEEVCVSKIGFIISLVITALLALVAVAIAVSCWLMAYRKRPKSSGPLPHPREFPNPLFSSPEPPIHHLDEPDPDYLH